MKEVSFLRHSGWFGPETAGSTVLNIIGVGATGSHIGLYAAKMGFHNFQIWDGDIVENHNLPNQIYENQDIGNSKVEAFRRILNAFNPHIQVETHNYFFNSEQHKELLNGPLVLTVDTMSARKDIYNSFKYNWKVKKVFETRLGFDYGELNIIDCFSPEQLGEWSSTLMNDEDIPEGPCNLRICTTLVCMVSGYAVHKICDMISSSNKDQEYSYQKKTIFNFNQSNDIKTYSIA
jgi:hypothetical protein